MSEKDKKHPVQILVDEHTIILNLVEELKNLAKKIKEAGDFDSVEEEMLHTDQIKKNLENTEIHYLREEKVLFPYLEKHGITQPPAVMRMEHDQIRETIQIVYNLIDNSRRMPFEEFKEKFEKGTELLGETLSSHFFKENNLLFPSALNIIEKKELKNLLKEFNKIEYSRVAPAAPKAEVKEEKETTLKLEGKNIIYLEAGYLSQEEIEAIFDTLPLEITFINIDDTVQYFNQTKKRILKRTEDIIGQKIQQLYPEANIQMVNQIIKDFKSGRRDAEEFWIIKEGKDIQVTYIPIYNKKGEYLGCIETTLEPPQE